MCVCVCVYVYIHTHTHRYMYICLYLSIYIKYLTEMLSRCLSIPRMELPWAAMRTVLPRLSAGTTSENLRKHVFFISRSIQLTPQQHSAEPRNSAGAEALAVARRPEEASFFELVHERSDFDLGYQSSTRKHIYI